MQALRLHEVIQRVVRWHNRHPLARRISASQVHSIGEVLLPFAADRPWPAAGPAPAMPASPGPAAPHDLPQPEPLTPPTAHLAAPAEAGPAEGDDLLALADDLLAPDATPPAPASTPDLADAPTDAGLAAPDPDASGDPASAPHAPGPTEAADVHPPDPSEADLATALPAAPAQPLPDTAPVPDLVDDAAASQALLAAHEAALNAPPEPLAPALPQAEAIADPAAQPAALAAPAAPAAPSLAEVVERRAAARTAAAAAPQRGPRQWWARLRQALRGRPAGMPRLKAAFNHQVFWPSQPATVARWAQHHAQAQPLAPADWPHRVVEADPAQRTQLRRQGQVHGIELHALTAAVGVGDRRMRLLLGADGSILGPRAYSPPRLASAGTVLLLGVLGLGWGLRPPGATTPADGAALAALTTSAASAPLAVVEAAASAAPAASDAASATLLAHAAPAEPTDPAASAPAPHDAAPAVPAHGAAPPASTALATTALASAAAVAEAAPPAASAPLARIRPALSDEAKLAAKAESDRLRGGPAQAAAPAAEAGPVYAVVSPPNRERRVAMNHLTIMRRAGGRLPPPAPDHGELMQNQGEWRAAWWPFASLADAERARVMLAGRGLHAEVVEF